MTSPQHQTAVFGVSGYAGAELARLLLHHPRLRGRAPVFFGRPEEEQHTRVALTDLHPQLADNNGAGGMTVEPFRWDALSKQKIDVVFLATPHEQSRAWVPKLLEHGVRVIDLSGAWRLDEETNRAIYKLEDHDPAAAQSIQQGAVYGLPELHRKQIASARLIANPGCYATSIILALAPLIHEKRIDLRRGIVCDSKSGVSGAGKTPTAKTHFMNAADNLSAYSVFNHRHIGEMLEQLGLKAKDIIFTPHLLPIPRGIFSTVYVNLQKRTSPEDIDTCFRNFYTDSPMVRWSGARLPEIQYCVRTSYCDLGFALASDGQRLIVVSCLDNLLKGAASQAVQNMNLLFGWPEQEGTRVKFVIKLGGASLENPVTLRGSTQAIVDLVRDGHQVAVVHGGGAALTRTLAQLGKQSEFIAGLRVTDAETRDAALMVLAGRVNKQLVAAIGKHGQAAVGLSGGDGLVFRARKKRTAPDLGYVGEIASSDPRWLLAVWQMQAIPVISSLALGFDGEYYNVNADEMAAACAMTCHADVLVFLTDVPGVRGADGEVMRWLTLKQIPELTRTAVVSGGMLPKLGACREALLGGVQRVRIFPADSAALLPDICSARTPQGTEVMVA